MGLPHFPHPALADALEESIPPEDGTGFVGRVLGGGLSETGCHGWGRGKGEAGSGKREAGSGKREAGTTLSWKEREGTDDPVGKAIAPIRRPATIFSAARSFDPD
ncbi:MAG: hypothetical protein ACXWM9_09345 [Gemmatimonadaceae bacterium]